MHNAQHPAPPQPEGMFDLERQHPRLMGLLYALALAVGLGWETITDWMAP